MRKLVSIVALASVLLAACGGGSGGVAATVDGQDVTVGDVERLINSDGETVTKVQFAQFLAYEIQWAIINAAAEADYDLTFTEEEVAAEADTVYEDFSEEGQSREDFLATNGVTEAFLESIARQGLIDEGIRMVLLEDVEDPTAEEIEAARAESVTALTTVCSSHILVPTEEEAEEIMTRLDDGDDFADLAAEFGTDGTAQEGGVLGCSAPTQYVEPFAEAIMVAPVGEVYDEIVQTQFGFHVIEVTDRQEPAEEDLPTEEELVDGLRDQAVLTELETWFNEAVSGAEVTVEEEYGTWGVPPPSQTNPNPTTPTVIPPATE
ncbi:MAG: peptidylprolyl isomerase [Acidimicrobiia bacterium]|jgi:foldase protein PrsA